MKIRRPRPHREQIALPATQSFAARAAGGESFPFMWHHHPEVELTLIVRGAGLRFVGDSVEEFGAADLVLLGADLPHTWRSPPGAAGGVACQVIQFLPAAWGGQFLSLPELAGVNQLLHRARRGLSIEGRVGERCRERMGQLIAAAPGSAGRLARLLDILALLSGAPQDSFRPLSTQPASAAPDARTHAVVKRVLDRLQEEWEEAPTQLAAARLAGMTPSSFSRFFHRHVGKPYVQYLNDWRVGRACRLLAESDASVAEVALRSGFNNLANFNRRFRAIKQMTPRQYRRLARPGEG